MGTNYAPQTCGSRRSLYHMFVPLRWSRDQGVMHPCNGLEYFKEAEVNRYTYLSLLLVIAIGCSQDDRPFHIRVEEEGVLITTIIDDSSLTVSNRGDYEDALHDYLLKRKVGMVDGSAIYGRSGSVIGLSLSMRVLDYKDNIGGITTLLRELGAGKDTLFTIHEPGNQQVISIE